MLITVIKTHKADFLERKQRALKNNNNNFLSTPQNVQKKEEKGERKTSSVLIIAKHLSIRSNTNGPNRARWEYAQRFCSSNSAGLRAASGKGPDMEG